VSRCNAASNLDGENRFATGKLSQVSRLFHHRARLGLMPLPMTKEPLHMLDKPSVNTFAHVKPGDTPWTGGGLRDFFLYRDLGVAEATGGRVVAQLVKANEAPEKGTGWHRHGAEFHIVFMLKGWARFMYEDKEHLVAAGDCVHQRPGINHYLFDYSSDMEYLEVVGPADFSTIDGDGPVPVPEPKSWQTT